MKRSKPCSNAIAGKVRYTSAALSDLSEILA